MISAHIPRNNLVLVATLSLGLTVAALLFAGIMIVCGSVDPTSGTWITVVLVTAVNTVVMNLFRRQLRPFARLRTALAYLISTERPTP